MAKKKRRRRPPPRPDPEAQVATAPPSVRRDRKEEARRQREALRRRIRRRQLLRRGLIYGGVAAVIGAIVAVILVRQQQTQALVDQARAIVTEVGCSPWPDQPNVPDEGARHLQAGETATYASRPATSGVHNPIPLPNEPNVYDTPVPEDQAVHNLEHGFVLVYYRQSGDGALSEDAVRALEGVVEGQSEVIMAPYEGLPEGTALALVSWTRLETCPSDLTADQAVTVTRAFISQFKNSAAAPEPAA